MRKKLLGLIASIILFPAPALPATPPPLDAYGDLPSIEKIAISPDGTQVATVGTFNGIRMVLVVGKDRKPRLKAPLGNTKLRGIEWVGEDRVLTFLSTTDIIGSDYAKPQMEFLSGMILPLDGGKPQVVFEGNPKIPNSIWGNYGIRHVDGKWLGYFGGIVRKESSYPKTYAFDNGRPYLFAVDLESNSPQEVAQAAAEGHTNSWLVDAKGKVAATLNFRQSDGAWFITNAQPATLATGLNPNGHVGLVSFDQSGTDVIYVADNNNGQEYHWYEVPLSGGPPKEILKDAQVARTYVDPRNGRLLGYLDANSEKPVMFDPAHQAVIDKVFKAFPNLDVIIEQWTPDFMHVLVEVSGSGDSGTYYAVDMNHMRADPVAYSRLHILPDQVGPVSSIQYTATDGLNLDGILTLPPSRSPKNLPLIVLPPPAPHTHVRQTFYWLAQAFASRGYAVFEPNFRGSSNRGENSVHAGDGQWGRKIQTDISDGLADLARRGIVDPKRACIMGIGYGGYAALAGVTLQHGLYRCAVAVAPISDFKDMVWTKYRESGNNQMVLRNLTETLGNLKTLDEVSPRKHAVQADAPILLIHGKDDTVVDFKQSANMADALKRAGKPYELVVLQNEDHWLSKADTRKQMLEAAMDFVKKNNPPD